MRTEMGRKKTMSEDLAEHTGLDASDLKVLGKGFVTRVRLARSRMKEWNEEGYSFQQVMNWNTEEHQKDSKIPRRQLKMFWREVDLLKRIIVLAEFCKANGLDFQAEFEKHKIDINYEQNLHKLMEKYEKVGVTYNMLNSFLHSAKPKVDKLNPTLLDRVSLTLLSDDIKTEVWRAWLRTHPDDRGNRRPFKVLYSNKQSGFQCEMIDWLNPREVLAQIATETRLLGPDLARERQEYLKLYQSVRRRMAAENLMELRDNFCALERKTRLKQSKLVSGGKKQTSAATR